MIFREAPDRLRPMFSSLLRKITAHFRPPGAAAPSGQMALALLMTVLLFAVANAYRHPPGLLAQLDESTGRATENTRTLDATFVKLTATGNILLRFQGYDYSQDALQPKATFEYIRASYAVYPKRVYVADDLTVIPQAYTGNPFPGFDPSAAWLDEHHITTLIVAEQTPASTTRYYALPRGKF
jgi:hypothetical protein